MFWSKVLGRTRAGTPLWRWRRAGCAPAFARWLQANFAGPEIVATIFGVRYQTALNWWNGAHRASGDTVALVFLSYPQALAWFLSEWEDRA